MVSQHSEMRYAQESFAIIGAAMKVHSILGPGFTEKVYQDALAIEFRERGIPFKREITMHASYKGITLIQVWYIYYHVMPKNYFLLKYPKKI